LGYCTESNLRIVAYEFATMGSLHDVLHGMILHNLYNMLVNSLIVIEYSNCIDSS
jgi:hypothetical protein